MLSRKWGKGKVLAITVLVAMLLATFAPVVDAQQVGTANMPPALRAAIATGNMNIVTRAMTVLSGGNPDRYAQLAQLAFEAMVAQAVTLRQDPAIAVQEASRALVRAAAGQGGEALAIITAQGISASAVSFAQRNNLDPSLMANGALAGAELGARQAGVNSATVLTSATQAAQQQAQSLGITLTITTTPTTATTGTTATSATSDTTDTTATTTPTVTTFTTFTTVTTQTTVTTRTTLTTVTTQTTVTSSSTTTTIASPTARLGLDVSAGPRS